MANVGVEQAADSGASTRGRDSTYKLQNLLILECNPDGMGILGLAYPRIEASDYYRQQA